MIYTIADIRALARSKDERLEDVDKYPDSWIDKQIEHGFEVAQDSKQVFATKEKYDLSADISNGLEKVEIILQEEPHSIYAIEVDGYNFQYEITNNKHIIVTILPSASSATDKTITIRYFYYPTMPMTEIEMSPEVYHFFRHCLYVNLYGSLRDKESEMYHQSQVDRFIKEGTFAHPIDFETTSVEQFWSKGWL